jgi:uncharacterized membrane protein YdjX (TVP38/TMEM64 family)
VSQEGDIVGRNWPIGLIVWALAAAVVIVGATWAASTGVVTWSMAVDAKEMAAGFVAGYPVVAYLAFMAFYVAMALALFPAQLWVTVFGSMLFGFWPGFFVAWLSTVLAAGAVFVAARSLLAERYRTATAKYLGRIEEGFAKDQFMWMLSMRLMPVVPFVVSNVAPTFLGARIRPYMAAAVVGSIPHMLMYCYVGAKAGEALNRDAPPDVGSFAASMAPALLILAVLPLAAVAVRRLMRRRA